MSDKITLIVERDGEYHRYVPCTAGQNINEVCKLCSLNMQDKKAIELDACDFCVALDKLYDGGHFEKVVTK